MTNCTLFAVLTITSIVLGVASIPLFAVGENKMSQDMTKNPFTVLVWNAESIAATVMLLLGLIFSILFGVLWSHCKK